METAFGVPVKGFDLGAFLDADFLLPGSPVACRPGTGPLQAIYGHAAGNVEQAAPCAALKEQGQVVECYLAHGGELQIDLFPAH